MPRTKCNDLPNRSILHMEALAVRRMKWPVCWVAGQNGRERSCHDITNLSPGSPARKALGGALCMRPLVSSALRYGAPLLMRNSSRQTLNNLARASY